MSTAVDRPPAGAGAEGVSAERIRAIPARHPARWIATIVVLFFVVVFALAVATNKNFQWGVVGHYFTTYPILHGILVTLELTVLAMAIGIVLGIVLGVMRLSPVPIISGAAWVYVWFFRGTPVLVQIFFWFFVAALTGPHPAVGLPLSHVVFFHLSVNTLITPFVAATLGLGLNEGAYMAEIVRAGILSVGEGQTEAAQALGMSRLQTMRLIVLPQAMRVIVPPTGNETISMLKTSSLASFIGVVELFEAGRNIYIHTFQTIPVLITVSLWYLLITSVLTAGQFYVERYYARGALRTLPPTPLQRFRALFARNIVRFHAEVAPPAPAPRSERR